VGLFNRRPKLAADRRPALDPDERMLAWAEVSPRARAESPEAGAEVSPGDGVAVVTTRGLWLPGRSHRLGWHDIHKAVWSGRELAVTPAELVEERDGYRVVADGPVETYLLVDPGEVPNQVRARVTASVPYTSHHPIGGGGVRVAARRVSGVDGLTWTVRYDPGTASDDDATIEQTDQLVSTARATTAPPV
jgi:hypothetical protein